MTNTGRGPIANLRSTSKLIETYLEATPVTAATGFVALEVPHESPIEPTLFTVGSDGTVHRIRTNSDSSTGLVTDSLPFPQPIAQVAAALDAEGRACIFGLPSKSDGSVWVCVEDSETRAWSAAVRAATLPSSLQPSSVAAWSVGASVVVAVLAPLFGDGRAPFVPFLGLWANETLSLTRDGLTGSADGLVDAPSMTCIAGPGGSVRVLSYITPGIVASSQDSTVRELMAGKSAVHKGEQVSFAVPDPMPGYLRMGHTFCAGSAAVGYLRIPQLVGIDDPTEPPLLVNAQSFTERWADSHISFWRPAAQNIGSFTYLALGDLLSLSKAPPDLRGFGCVRADLTSMWTPVSMPWTRNTVAAVIAVPRDAEMATGFFQARPKATPDGPIPILTTFALPTVIVEHDVGGATTKIPVASPRFVSRGLIVPPLTSGGQLDFIGILDDGKLYARDNASLAWVSLDDLCTFTSVTAVRTSDGGIEVFAVSRDRRMYQTRWVPGATPGWTTMAPLDLDQQYVSVTATRDAAGRATAFALRADHTIVRATRDAVTSDWTIETLEVDLPGQTRLARCYSTEVTAYGADGFPAPNRSFTITTSIETTLHINGKSWIVDRDYGAEVTTNGLGRIAVLEEVTSLAAATLQLREVDGSTSLSIEPNAYVLEHFGDTTAGEIAGVTKRDGKPMLPDQPDRGSVAAALAEKVRMMASLAKPEARRASSYAFSFDLTPHTPVQRLSIHEFDAHVGQLRETSALSLPSFLGGWGDAWRAIGDGIATAANVLLTSAAEGLRAAVTFLIDGITYLFEAVVNAAEQVFDVVEAVFKRAGVAFTDLVEWVGMLFAREDLLRTKAAIIWTIEQQLEFAVTAVTSLKSKVASEISDWKHEIDAALDHYIAQLAPGDTIGSFQASNARPSPVLSDHNVLFNALNDQAGRATPGAPSAIHALVGHATASPLAALAATLEEVCTEQLAGGPSGPDAAPRATWPWKGLWDWLRGLADDPTKFLGAGLAELLRAIKSVAGAGLDFLARVVSALADAVVACIGSLRSLLSEKWEIPVVSALYREFVGGDLTALDLIATILAIPVTVTHKLVTKRAPFADDASLVQFKGRYTSTWLQTRVFGGAPRAAVLVANDDVVERAVFQFLRLLNAVSNVCLAAVDGALSAAPVTVVPQATSTTATKLFNVSVVSLAWIAWGTDFPQTRGAFALGVWACGVVPPLFDGILLVRSRAETTYRSADWTNIGIGVFGVVQGGLGVALALTQAQLDVAELIRTTASAFVEVSKFLRLQAVNARFADAPAVVCGCITFVGLSTVAVSSGYTWLTDVNRPAMFAAAPRRLSPFAAWPEAEGLSGLRRPDPTKSVRSPSSEATPLVMPQSAPAVVAPS